MKTQELGVAEASISADPEVSETSLAKSFISSFFLNPYTFALERSSIKTASPFTSHLSVIGEQRV